MSILKSNQARILENGNQIKEMIPLADNLAGDIIMTGNPIAIRAHRILSRKI
jgi:hypothetical protein